MKRILVVGEINVDLVFRDCHAFPQAGKEVLAEDFVVTPGSSAMICAMGLAALGNPVAFIGNAGTDTWGDLCVEAMRSAGIDVSGVNREASLRTGVTASLSTRQDRALVTFAGATATLRAEDVSEVALRDADHLHISSYYLQQALRCGCRQLLEQAHQQGLSTSLDPGFDPREAWADDLLDVLDEVDVFLPNDVELAGISAQASLVSGLRMVSQRSACTVVKRGRLGSVTLEGEHLLEAPAYAVEAADSTGAGDSFNAGFLHAWLRQLPLRECLAWGNGCGSLSTRGVGGTASQPSEAEVLALIEAGR